MATKQKGAITRIIESAVDAAEEVGRAAESLKDSMRHAQVARIKARPAGRAVRRTGKKVVRATKSVAKRTTRAIKKRR